MQQVNAVVFDIGNVLIKWQPEGFYDRVIGPDRRKALFHAVDLTGVNEGVDRGDDFHIVFHALADQHPDWRAEILMWHDRWIEIASPAIDHSVRLLRTLRQADVPVFALSNFGVETFEIAARHYPFFTEFDRRYISGHLKVMKPEVAIYQMLEDDCGFDPQTLLFTDDRIENISVAAERGWQTHLFDGPRGWANRLVDAGLLTKEAAQ
ncbi:HAD family hydrolase [Yoonia sp. R2-816]|uniref:HAD family hydrolase n=1 Tax=Yoonia sp. R2-816 TaxID=3342638 RepID=UPI00372B5D12